MKTNQLYLTKFYDGGLIPIKKEQLFVQIPETWIPIVDKLVDDMFEAGWNGHVDQVKEKFGGLRFYIPMGNDKIFELIDEAEEKSQNICIVCGDPATTSTKGWVTHVCDEHKDRK